MPSADELPNRQPQECQQTQVNVQCNSVSGERLFLAIVALFVGGLGSACD